MDITTFFSVMANDLNDPNEDEFTKAIKIQKISDARISLISLIDNHYLTELEYTESSAALTAGKVLLTAIATGKSVIKGEEGIISVKVTSGKYCTKIDKTNPKRTQNYYYSATLRNPLYEVKGGYIYVYPTSVLNADITFLKVPDALLVASTTVELNDALHTILLLMAEALCWYSVGKKDEGNNLTAIAHKEIALLNEKVRPQEHVGEKETK